VRAPERSERTGAGARRNPEGNGIISMSSSDEKQRRRRPGWLGPLLWLVLPALVALAPWVWQRARGSRSPRRIELPPLRLTGDVRRDRLTILQRAAERLAPADRPNAVPEAAPPSRAALLGEIGVELLALD